jgi:hypothetical protein
MPPNVQPRYIRLNLSHAFINKATTPDTPTRYCKKHRRFYPATISLDGLIDHIGQGKAWTPGYFKDNRRTKANFVSSQLLALDLDKCPLDTDAIAADPFIRQYAFLVYRTPSYTPEVPKHRVLFVLDEPITGQHAVTRWEAMQIGLMAHMAHLQPDPACKDAARLYYGSTQVGGWTHG